MSTSAISPQSAIAFGGVTPSSAFTTSPSASITTLAFSASKSISRLQAPGFVSVSRGRCNLFLCEGDQGHAGSWVWIDGKDVEALHDEYRGSGAQIRNPPTNYPWALEMQVEDPDGNILRLGSDPKPDQPTGDWLDMNGVRWSSLPGGQWKRVESS